MNVSVKKSEKMVMGKKIACLAVIVALAVSVFGCTQKTMELTPEMETNLTGAAKFGVYFEVYTKYGLEPVITVDRLNAFDASAKDHYRIGFTATGTYIVVTDTGENYTGTFKVKGHWEAHGHGTDKCDISAPRNGLKTLPENPIVWETEATADTAVTAETTICRPLLDYIDAKTPYTGRTIEKVYESDVNQDGHPDLCVTVIYGSGIISSAVVVYDVQNNKGYILDERMSYDYSIMGASEDLVAVCRIPYGGKAKTYGVLAIAGDNLVFKEKANALT